jgi:SPP1 family predicted phage head-tail adaptor
MRAGDLRHQVILQSLVPVQNETTGIITDTWVTFATGWAEFHPASVREFVAAGIVQSKIMGAFVIRYRAGVKASMRILHGAGIYNVEGVLADPKRGTEYLTLPVSEVLNG